MTLPYSKSSNQYPIIPKVGHSPVALWDINHGLELTAGGTLVGWRDVMAGMRLCPITADMVTETARFSGSRGALSFNGTSQGLRGWLGELRRTGNVLAMYVQLVTTENAATWRQVCELSVDGGGTAKRLSLLHPATIDHIQATGNADNNTLEATSGWDADTDLVLGAARVAGTKLELFRNGVSIGSQADTTSGQPIAAADLIVGHSAFTTNGAFFAGSIRRIAVYNVAHDDVEAVIVDAAWRGL